MDDAFIVNKIKDGIVIDHVTTGKGIIIPKILGIDSKSGKTIAILINAPSGKMGKKDMLKIEGKTLHETEANIVALVSPGATINVIKDYKIIEKRKAQLPSVITGIIRCANVSCITNAENMPASFRLVSESPAALRCDYCDTVVSDLGKSEGLYSGAARL